MSDAPTQWSSGMLILAVAASLIAGVSVGSAVDSYVADAEQDVDADAEPWVGCVTAETSGETLCFVHGDVRFEWLNGTATNGSIQLDQLPMDNSTTRRTQ